MLDLAEMLEVGCADVLALEGQLLAASAGPWVPAVLLEARVATLLDQTVLLLELEGSETEPFEVTETSANATSCLLSAAENERLEEDEDHVVDSRVLLFAYRVVDLLDSCPLVEIFHASNLLRP